MIVFGAFVSPGGNLLSLVDSSRMASLFQTEAYLIHDMGGMEEKGILQQVQYDPLARKTTAKP
jgi:hypothetical protein